MIKQNTVFFDGRKIGTYKFVTTAGSGHINFNGFKPYQLRINKNQQIVLERLKELTSNFDLADAIYRFENSENWGESEEHYDIAYETLNDKERLQVIQAACQWALEQEDQQ